MTDVLIVVALILVAATATAAVVNRDPLRQALVLSFLGLALALLFTFVQAPDVALSQLAVGSAVTPLMILLTVRKAKRGPAPQHRPAPGTPPSRRDGRAGRTGPGRPPERNPGPDGKASDKRGDKPGDRRAGERRTGEGQTGEERTGERRADGGEGDGG